MPSKAQSKQLVLIVSVVLGLVFAADGVTKVLGLSLQVESHQFGLPSWVLPVVGLFELVFAGLLVAKVTRSWGAMGLACVVIGESLARVMTQVMLPMLFVNAVLGFAAGWLVLKHRPAFLQVRRHA